jgi:hypothetical protein
MLLIVQQSTPFRTFEFQSWENKSVNSGGILPFQAFQSRSQPECEEASPTTGNSWLATSGNLDQNGCLSPIMTVFLGLYSHHIWQGSAHYSPPHQFTDAQ